MATKTKIKSLPQGQGRLRYPWDDWFDGGVWMIEAADVPAGDLRAFTNQIRSRASVMGVLVSVHFKGDHLLIQARQRD